MKQTLLYSAVIMFALTGCIKENPEVETIPVDEEKIWVEFSAGTETKASLVEGDAVNDHQIHWEVGDEISINGETFVTEDKGAKAKFGAKVAASFLNVEEYNAIYPASAGTEFQSVVVKDAQTATEGGFDDIVAVACSPDKTFQFKHVTSLVKFQIPADFNVEEVTISADEPLAGTVSVTMDTEESIPAIEVVDGINKVTLSGDFKTGVNYYVAVLPGEKTNLTVSFNGYTSKVWDKKVTINQGRVANMGTLPHPGVYEINDEAGLFWLAEQVASGNTFDGKTVVLTDNITMTQPWTPIGEYNNGDPALSFKGTFDGQDHTISGLKVTGNQCLGFFGAKYAGDVLNVKFDGAQISGNHFAGVVVGWASGSKAKKQFKIDGCEVTNSTVTLAAEQLNEEWDNGDKAGGIVGFAQLVIVSNNQVSETTITGYRDIGGVVGTASNVYNSSYTTDVVNNTLGDGVTVTVDNTHNYKKFTSSSSYNAKAYCGRDDNANGGPENVIENNTGEAVINVPEFVYLVPNSNWEQANARFAVYFFGNGEIWKDMTDLDGDGIYEVEVPDGGYTNMIFCRMNPGVVENNFNDGTKWNQTPDLSIEIGKYGIILPSSWGDMVWSESSSFTMGANEIGLLISFGDWKNDGATFSAKFVNGTTSKEVTLTSLSSTAPSFYKISLPAGTWTDVQFNRKSSDGNTVWNNTGEQSLTNKNYFVVTNWNDSCDSFYF